MVLETALNLSRKILCDRAVLPALYIFPILLGTTALLPACSQNITKIPSPTQISEMQISAQDLYNNGLYALNTKKYGNAAIQFEMLQQKYPYSDLIPNTQIMEGYAYYLNNQYPEAVQQLNRFLQLHPTDPKASYVYYIRALCFYEQVADVRRDQQSTKDAMIALNEVINRFPDTIYARDAKLKLDLCLDHLAGKEMLIGRYYERQRDYQSAINRFQRVVYDYQTTGHVPEALHRLVEIYLKLGLTDQARKTAGILGYNYPGSKWYQYSYDNLVTNNLSEASPSPRFGSTDTARNPNTNTIKSSSPGFFVRIWKSIF